MDNKNSYFDFKLTGDQERVTDKLLDFFDSDKDVFILKGYAGTGKTTLIKGIVKYLGKHKRPFTLMASTGRAAKVLSEKTGMPAVTVHSKIYRPRVIETRNEGEVRMVFELAVNTDPFTAVYFIDEASMLSNHPVSGSALSFGSGRLISDLFRYAGKRKVVFIGDIIQLPPVNTRFSAALNSKYLDRELGKEALEEELSEVLRYDTGSAIGWNTTDIRKTVLSGRYPYLSIRAADMKDAFIYHNERDMIAAYAGAILAHGVNNTMFIVLSNKMASKVNNQVRSLLFKKNKANVLNPGESLIVGKNNYLHGALNGDHVFFNNSLGTVRMGDMEFIRAEVRIDEAGTGARIIRAYLIKDLLLSNARDLSVEEENALMKNYFVRMSKAADEVHSALTGSFDDVAGKKDEVKERLGNLNYPVSVPDELFGSQPSKNDIKRKLIIANIQKDPFLNALRVKYGYAVTCHKAQGGEWNDVFIVFEPFLFRSEKENQYRWAYTAISRAAKRVHFLNNMCLY